MDFARKKIEFVALAGLAAAFAAPLCPAQSSSPPPPAQPGMFARINATLRNNGKSAWTPEQLAVMVKLREAALNGRPFRICDDSRQ